MCEDLKYLNIIPLIAKDHPNENLRCINIIPCTKEGCAGKNLGHQNIIPYMIRNHKTQDV